MLAAAVAARAAHAAAGRRPAVRLLRGLERAGDRAPRSGSSRRPAATPSSSSAAARSVERARAIVGAGIPVMGHVGPHAADRDRARRLPLPGPHRRARARGHARRARAPGGRLLRDRLRGDPGRAHRADHAAHADPGDRHRRRPGDRRPGAGLPRPARHLRRPRGALRQALRRRARRDDRGRDGVRRGRARRAATPSPSTATRWRPDEIERLHELLARERRRAVHGRLHALATSTTCRCWRPAPNPPE